MGSFPKHLRIKNDNLMQQLFSRGKSVSCGGITLKYMEEQKELKVGFAAPKRLHSSAVKRNLIKRRMRNSFRLQQHILGPSFVGVGYFIYNEPEIKNSQEIYDAFTVLLKKWKDCGT